MTKMYLTDLADWVKTKVENSMVFVSYMDEELCMVHIDNKTYSRVRRTIGDVNRIIEKHLDSVKHGGDHMLNDEFVRKNGRVCPVCRCNNISSVATQLGSYRMCNECKSTWVEKYSLVGYEDLEKGINNE